MGKRVTAWLDYRGGCWMAGFWDGDEPDAEIVASCGTHEIQTPFTARASRAQVERMLRERNPGALVEMLS